MYKRQAPNPSNGHFRIAGDLVEAGNELTIHNLMGTVVEKRIIRSEANLEFSLNLQAVPTS